MRFLYLKNNYDTYRLATAVNTERQKEENDDQVSSILALNLGLKTVLFLLVGSLIAALGKVSICLHYLPLTLAQVT